MYLPPVCLEFVQWKHSTSKISPKKCSFLGEISCAQTAKIYAGGSACSSLPVRLDHLFFTCRFCLQCFVPLPSTVFSYVQTQTNVQACNSNYITWKQIQIIDTLVAKFRSPWCHATAWHQNRLLQTPATLERLGSTSCESLVLWGDIGLARNMCKFQPHKPGPTQTPCAPPVRELWVACSATQELPTRPSYAPKTLEQKCKSVGTKKAVLEVLEQKKFTLDTQVTHWHTASKRCQPAWLQTYRDWRIDRWIGGR